MGTREVIERHLGSVRRGDVAAVMAGFHDDAVLVMRDGVLRGRDELTASFRRLMEGLFAPGTYTFSVDTLQVEGQVAHMTWHAECDGTAIPFGTETYVVRDGRICAQTFAAVFEER